MFAPPRLHSMDGKNGKPSIFLNTSYELFLGNTGSEEMMVTASELFGFGMGAYEMKIVTGPLSQFAILLFWLKRRHAQTKGGEGNSIALATTVLA